MSLPTDTDSADPIRRQSVDALRDFIIKRLFELGHDGVPMSAREATRRANGLFSYETMRLLVTHGRHRGRITDRTVEGLSLALQVPVERIYSIAGLPAPGAPWEWPDRFRRLNPSQRRLVEQVAAAMLEAYDQGRNDR